MKTRALLLVIAFALTPHVHAALCAKHKGSAFIANVGECKECGGFTSSGAFKLCAKCSAKLAQCQACRADLKAGEKPSEPVKKVEKKEGDTPAIIHRAPNGKAFPAHWGEPPRAQTRDLRPFPGGYGSGSGTLARWIQMNLDKDAAKAGEKKPDPKPAPNPNSVPASENDSSEIGKVTTALDVWAKSKTSCAGNYSYTVRFVSAFGFGSTTTIVVENSKVVERRYVEFDRSRPVLLGDPAPPNNNYVEKGAQVGKATQGAPAKPLDELYADARKIAAEELQPRDRRYVATDKNGLLLSCFIIDTRIADDAPRRGVAIDSITLAAPKPALKN
ncbi:MAG: hypothetical protein EXS29_06885 [Pedosphaera sp.]|nr:hypothetical protein [Pedosphaera sp.]